MTVLASPAMMISEIALASSGWNLIDPAQHGPSPLHLLRAAAIVPAPLLYPTLFFGQFYGPLAVRAREFRRHHGRWTMDCYRPLQLRSPHHLAIRIGCTLMIGRLIARRHHGPGTLLFLITRIFS